MANTTVRISSEARDLLREIARTEGRSMQAVVERALEYYRRRRFLELVNADWSAVREEEGEWRSVLEGTLADGLSEDEVWTAQGEAVVGDQGNKRE
jgi:predicted transcriptional regulator